MEVRPCLWSVVCSLWVSVIYSCATHDGLHISRLRRFDHCAANHRGLAPKPTTYAPSQTCKGDNLPFTLNAHYFQDWWVCKTAVRQDLRTHGSPS